MIKPVLLSMYSFSTDIMYNIISNGSTGEIRHYTVTITIMGIKDEVL